VGKLVYGSRSVGVEFDDRTLQHLQVAITQKLRRRESFTFSWRDPVAIGGGRSSFWMSPTIPLCFRYAGAGAAALNRAWVLALIDSSNSSGGLELVEEPEADSAAHRE